MVPTPASRLAVAWLEERLGGALQGLGVGEAGLVGEHFEVCGADGDDEVAAAAESVQVDDVGLILRAAQQLVGRHVEERLVELQLGLGYVHLDDGVDGVRGQTEGLETGRLEAHRREVELLGAGRGVQRERGHERVGDLQQVALDDLLVGAVVDQAQVAFEAIGNGVVDRKRKRLGGCVLDGNVAGADGGRGRRGRSCRSPRACPRHTAQEPRWGPGGSAVS